MDENIATLAACTIYNTSKFTLAGKYTAKCLKIVDGDTAHFAFVPPGLKRPRAFLCRMAHYNSAEIHSRDQNEKAAAIAAKDVLQKLIGDKIVNICVAGDDKYGRLLVDVYIEDEQKNRMHVNTKMIEGGHGKPYDGRGEKKW